MDSERFCAACDQEFSPEGFPLGGMPVAACGPYGGVLKAAVLGLKSVARTSFAEAMGDKMAQACGELGDLPGFVVVPVPSVASRKRTRGFEPARLLAARVSQKLGLPQEQVLVAVGEREAQKSLSAGARRSNLRGVFRAAREVPPRVVLVDDVVTTGATMLACRRVLSDGGAEEVVGLCFARTMEDVC